MPAERSTFNRTSRATEELLAKGASFAMAVASPRGPKPRPRPATTKGETDTPDPVAMGPTAPPPPLRQRELKSTSRSQRRRAGDGAERNAPQAAAFDPSGLVGPSSSAGAGTHLSQRSGQHTQSTSSSTHDGGPPAKMPACNDAEPSLHEKAATSRRTRTAVGAPRTFTYNKGCPPLFCTTPCVHEQVQGINMFGTPKIGETPRITPSNDETCSDSLPVRLRNAILKEQGAKYYPSTSGAPHVKRDTPSQCCACS